MDFHVSVDSSIINFCKEDGRCMIWPRKYCNNLLEIPLLLFNLLNTFLRMFSKGEIIDTMTRDKKPTN